MGVRGVPITRGLPPDTCGTSEGPVSAGSPQGRSDRRVRLSAPSRESGRQESQTFLRKQLFQVLTHRKGSSCVFLSTFNC